MVVTDGIVTTGNGEEVNELMVMLAMDRRHRQRRWVRDGNGPAGEMTNVMAKQ